MKRLIIILILLVIAASASDYFYKKTKAQYSDPPLGISVTYNSSLYSDEEISDALKAVKKKFRNFEGCTLTKLYYDEEHCLKGIDSYLTTGRGSINNITKENVIILLSSFETDENGGDGSFNASSLYKNWSWILIRDDRNSPWRVDDWGY